MEFFLARILCMVQAGSQKNINIFISYFFNSQIWLYQLMYDCHRNYITKLKKQKQNTVWGEETRNHAVGSTYLLIIWQWEEQRIQWEQQSKMLTGQWRTMLLHVLTITLSASVPSHKERNTANCHPFDTHVLFDTSFWYFSMRFVIKALKGVFTSLYDGHLIFVHSFSSNRKEER